MRLRYDLKARANIGAVCDLNYGKMLQQLPEYFKDTLEEEFSVPQLADAFAS